MATVIKTKEVSALNAAENNALDTVKKFLPPEVCFEIDEFLCSYHARQNVFLKNLREEIRIEEIRIRSDKRVYLTVGGRGIKHNVLLSAYVGADEVARILNKMCDGSLYAYGESIVKGYISLGGGVRVGVCGHASVEGGKILGVYDVSALNIRLPCRDIDVDARLASSIKAMTEQGRGTLIFSPPAQGKTTLLRSMVRYLSGGNSPMRVALIDSRNEMGGFLLDKTLCVDTLVGYPQAEGIRIATAFMNPQVIICDEIGSDEDAQAIAQAQNCGVPLIASSHGSDANHLLHRSGIRRLYDVGAFGLYVGIRISASKGFEYSMYGEEALLENNWNGTSFDKRD